MSILEIELTPDMAKRLNEKAKKRGLTAKAYAEALLTRDLQDENAANSAGEKRHSVMEFYGAGREAWAGVDVQQYINEMRDEWDR